MISSSSIDPRKPKMSPELELTWSLGRNPYASGVEYSRAKEEAGGGGVSRLWGDWRGEMLCHETDKEEIMSASPKPLQGKDCFAVFSFLANSTLEMQEGVTGSRSSDTQVQSADSKIGEASWGRWCDTERTGSSKDLVTTTWH